LDQIIATLKRAESNNKRNKVIEIENAEAVHNWTQYNFNHLKQVRSEEQLRFSKNKQNRQLLKSRSDENIGKMKEKMQKAMDLDRKQVTRKSLIIQYYNHFLMLIMQSKVQR